MLALLLEEEPPSPPPKMVLGFRGSKGAEEIF